MDVTYSPGDLTMDQERSHHGLFWYFPKNDLIPCASYLFFDSFIINNIRVEILHDESEDQKRLSVCI